MTQLPVLVDLDPASIETAPCCGVGNAAHEGRCNKNRWLQAQFKKGLRAKVLLTPDKRQCGYIEYLPGEYAWRGVDAGGYMFIHCIWTFFKQHQHRGLGSVATSSTSPVSMHGAASMPAATCSFTASGPSSSSISTGDSAVWLHRVPPR